MACKRGSRGEAETSHGFSHTCFQDLRQFSRNPRSAPSDPFVETGHSHRRRWAFGAQILRTLWGPVSAFRKSIVLPHRRRPAEGNNSVQTSCIRIDGASHRRFDLGRQRTDFVKVGKIRIHPASAKRIPFFRF